LLDGFLAIHRAIKNMILIVMSKSTNCVHVFPTLPLSKALAPVGITQLEIGIFTATNPAATLDRPS
jgi:hypothetical protein